MRRIAKPWRYQIGRSQTKSRSGKARVEENSTSYSGRGESQPREENKRSRAKFRKADPKTGSEN